MNMDRTKRVAVGTATLPWEDSPSAGVQRKKLEREAAESGQVTSVVRYAPGSSFSAHSHPLGEEILVLDGVFSDEHGDYPAGTYLRNPPGSSHSPASAPGCTLFVKLNMFDPADSSTVRVDTNNMEWRPGLVEGLSVMPLHEFRAEHTALVRWQPGTKFPAHLHEGGEEIFVIDGAFEDDKGTYPAGTWLRSPPGSAHEPFSSEGCTILVKTGHLGGP
ncbi:MAG: cupin domain-containing protein [Pseudomonadota bacterium]